MPSSRPLTVDVFALARDRALLEGRFPLVALPRLAASLVSTDGELDYAIRGQVDDLSRPGAAMRLRARLLLQCQRCNGPLELALARDATFRFVGSEEELDALPVEDDETDVIVGSRSMDVLTWVEDEAILSLPIVPRHDVCPVPPPAGGSDAGGEGAPRKNPFASLAALKRAKPDA
jgi:uncharacterized protein